MAYPLAVTLLFLIAPVISLAFILHGLFTSKRFAMWFGVLLAAAVGVFVYTLIPDPAMDLYRYYEQLDNLNAYSVDVALMEIWSGNDPLAYTLMYIVSKLFSNNFVPLAFSIIIYSTLFYVIFDYRKTILKSYDWRTSLILFFVLSTVIVFNAITGMRFTLALVIFVLALYLDVIKKKRILSTIIYLISPLIHSSMILLLIMRIGTRLLDRHPVIFYILAAFAGSATTLLLQFSEQMSRLPYMSHLDDRAADYLSPLVPPGFLYPFSLITCVLILVVIFLLHKRGTSISVFTKLTVASAIISLVNIFQFVIAMRFAAITKYLFILVLLEAALIHFSNGNLQKPLRVQVGALSALSVIILGSLAYQVVAFAGVNAQFNWTFPDVLLDNVYVLLMK